MPCRLFIFLAAVVAMKSISKGFPTVYRSARRTALLGMSLVLFGLACAESAPPLETFDVSNDPPDAAQEADSVSPDTDTSPTPTPDVETPPQPVCTAGQARCTSDTTREICRADGSGYDGEPCEAGTQCTEGQCQAVQACTPNSRYCHDGNNLLVCRSNGSGYTTQPCGDGNVCIGDACFSGKANGEACTNHDECGGQLCHCGSEESCPTVLSPAYCTHSCDASSCTGTEWCIEASELTGAHHYDHCVRRCDSACAITGMGCKYAPVKGADGLAWEQACVHRQMAGIGEECTTDAECLGGTCLRDYFSFGYCTRRCESGGCPSGSACVQLRDNEYWCSALCGDGVSPQGQCPLKVSRPTDLNITCKIQSIYDSNQAARVCTRT